MKKSMILLLSSLLLFAGSAFAEYKYQIKVDHDGGNVTPSQAYEMTQKDSDHIFIVDTRTRAEYQLIGHPEGAYNIPKKFWTGKLGEKEYGMSDNSDFGKALMVRFNPATDKLIFMCRSGKRSCRSCKAAIKAGWDPKNVYNMLGGFEGDKVKNKNSLYNGQRCLGGWKNEGLPWTYQINKKFVYKADLVR
ncbi:MAG: rhodanese-like domain-containing protein [Desulfatiglans sp.]|nr:rhodanese-like domain-containing protein [Thermodesulfobacteriota bacterium]MEE4352792.1 rhodanese-like domain-containing protein [Desulfatiglans sp.]